MGTSDDAQKKIDAYLARLRRGLRGMNEQDSREIVEELRSHIADRAAANGEVTAAGIDAALAGLGGAEELANQYMTDDLLARAESSRSPLHILESLFHWAGLSVGGFLVLLGTIAGYFLGMVFFLCAVLKPFHPHSAGLWMLPGSTGDYSISLRLGFGTVPAGGRELLGWWIMPIGVIVGCGLVMLTTHFALWCARQYRKSRVLPRR